MVPTASVVNDGGLSWLRKNYQRMKEQAEREQRSLDDVVAERYGVRTDGTQAVFTHSDACYSTYGLAAPIPILHHLCIFFPFLYHGPFKFCMPLVWITYSRFIPL